VDGAAHARRVAHLRLLLRSLLLPPRAPADLHALFLRLAGKAQLQQLRAGLAAFMQRHLLGREATPQLIAAVAAAEAGMNGEAMPDVMRVG
jgi:hypothetical protein